MILSKRENFLRAINRTRPQWVPNGYESVVTIKAPVVERPAAAGLDAWGVRWEYADAAHGGTYPAAGGQALSELAEWRSRLCVPTVAGLPWKEIAAQAADLDRENQLMQGFVEMGLFERSYLLLGMEAALVAYLEQPAEMAELLNAIADYKIALIEWFDDTVKLDLLWYGDDWGTQQALFLPPEVWRTVIRPPTARIYQCARRRGILVNQHSCGRIESIFGDLVEMGLNLFNPCQPCNDLAELKRRYGHQVTFVGGIDSQFVLDKPGVTPDEVRAEVRRRIGELAGGGGYVAAPSHGVPYRPELIAAMNEEIATCGRNCYAAAGN